jgi:hypothetical protein
MRLSLGQELILVFSGLVFATHLFSVKTNVIFIVFAVVFSSVR